MKYSVLVVDDDELVNEFLVETLQRSGYSVQTALSGEVGLEKFKADHFDIVLSDLKMPGMNGIELLEQIKRINNSVTFVLMTAFGTVETAVKAIKNGAHDFLLKPVLPETLELMLSRITEVLDLRSENEMLRKDVASKFQNIVGKSKPMQEMFDLVQTVANARSTVLVTGPSGTGKELIARALHHTSNRKDAPFIKLNCAALPESLVEAELFGYEKGAFTDARKTNRGRFERADGGTLLLDEISEMPLNLQSKLLRVIQEREFERVGSSTTISVDVRLVATTNRNLREYIEAGKFREDLYYRLNVIPIVLTPLKDRLEDVPLLCDHFIRKYAIENDKMITGITSSALKLLMKYKFPGNVRELENLIERAVVTGRGGQLTEDDFPTELAIGKLDESMAGMAVPMKLDDSNRYLILKTLEYCNWNKTRAAEVLGITTRTIRNKLAEYQTETEQDTQIQ